MSPRENADMIAEEELYELFERRRPDARSFRAGIDARVAERADAPESEQGSDLVRSTLWRRVASVLPIDPFGELLAGSSLGKASASKLLPGFLALPALVLAAAFGAFVLGTRSLRRSTAGAVPVDRVARGSIWKHGSVASRAMGVGAPLISLIQFGAIFSLLATWAFGGSLAIDFLMALLLVSMFALVVTVAGFRQAGLLSRPDVARLSVGILLSVYMGCFLWFHAMRLADDVSELGIGWPSGVILGGAALCLAAGRKWVSAGAVLLYGAGMMILLNGAGSTQSSPASLRRQLAAIELSTGDLARWEDAAALHGALAAVGAEQPDLEHVRAQVSAAMHSKGDVHPVVWSAAHRMGLVSRSDWQALAARPMESRALDQLTGELGEFPRTVYYQYPLPMLLAARAVSVHEREALAEKVLATWPEIGVHGAPERALGCVLALEELGRPDLVESLRQPARALLTAHWVSGAGVDFFAKVGGFSPNPAKFNTSMVDDTLAGIELMARFGVPRRVDLHLLRSYLRRESHGMPLFGRSLEYLRAEARASLLRVEEQLGLPARSWVERILAERLLIASVLVVLLCLLAIRLAPPVIDPSKQASAGAMP